GVDRDLALRAEAAHEDADSSHCCTASCLIVAPLPRCGGLAPPRLAALASRSRRPPSAGDRPPPLPRSLADHLDLHLEVDAVLGPDRVAHDGDELEHVGGAGAAGVDDPVGVDRGDLGAADAPALEPALLDEPAGELAGRILEDRAGVGHGLGLALGAAVAQRPDPRLALRAPPPPAP